MYNASPKLLKKFSELKKLLWLK